METFLCGSNPHFGRDPGPAPPRHGNPPVPPTFYTAPIQPLFPPSSAPPIPPPFVPPAAPHITPTTPYTAPGGQVPLAPGQFYIGTGMVAPGVDRAPGARFTTAHQGPVQYVANQKGSGRVPVPAPVQDPSFTAGNLVNHTGGIGLEPGYDYFFHREHTKIIVLKLPGVKAPWELTPGTDRMEIPFRATFVPANTTMAELLEGFGATNPDKARNRLTEVHENGNGRWHRGIAVCGDDPYRTGLTCREMGWDKTRTGLPGGKPAVYLYITKG
ncbi:hypothetical protein B0T24DRAFT_620237 [Lasiosphaeria ovina]|uniref:Uncharacterized protein n=1 Tax=Lasiosphaeria ovina TaxID=92902 RepID=A0AAE0NAP0_9PEZI|nr:hypothetical protein B0T24DRAFT_620237 [Lasiosphaeria ovina]